MRIPLIVGLTRSMSILVLVPLLLLNNAAAQDSFKPATFRTGDRSLENRIEFPDVSSDVNILVRCITTVSRSGEMLSGRTRWLNNPPYLTCLDYQEANRPFFDAVRTPLENQIINPAEVNGRRTAVVFSFAVRFSSVSGVKKITVYANHGTDDRYPMEEFIQSQVYRDRAERRCARGREIRVEFEYTVTVQGQGSLNSVVESDAGLGACEDNLTRGLELARFIPGHTNGEAVESIAVDYLYDTLQCENIPIAPRLYCYLAN